MRDLIERLERGDILILDGATGTEVQRRGALMDDLAWCATSVITSPEIIRETHMDYIHAGADIITANTFAAARHVLSPAGLGDETAMVNHRAMTLAKEAREAAADRPVAIAGSMSSMVAGVDLAHRPSLEEARASYREQAGLLVEAGSDLLLLEMMFDIDHASTAVAEAAATGLPVWVGFSCRIAPDGRVRMFREAHSDPHSDPEFEEVIGKVMACGGSVAGVMHTEIAHMTSSLEVLFAHWRGPVMAYAESGDVGIPIEWGFSDLVSPAEYARSAQGWVAMGVQIVGGCCGLGVEHVRALKDGLPTHLPDRAGS